MADQNSKIQLEGRATTMNAVLISIRPKWCEKIISGEKTIEVRKTRPKLATPFKCRIYCTKGWQDMGRNGKVIGEFTCDEIFCFPADSAIPWFLSRDACLTAEEIHGYLGEKAGFFWHISDLEIYDVPLDLGELPGMLTLKNGYGAQLWRIDRAPQDWCYMTKGGIK